jgi:hypothetical protein
MTAKETLLMSEMFGRAGRSPIFGRVADADGLDGRIGAEHKPVAAAVKARCPPGVPSERRLFLYDELCGDHRSAAMKELLRSNDHVLLSFAAAILRDAGIEAVQLDLHTSVLEGSIGALPRRLMVADDDHRQAERLIEEAMRDVATGTFRDAEDAAE